MKVIDNITISTTLFYKKYSKPKNRKYLEEILKNILNTILPSRLFELDEAEIERDKVYSHKLYIPDIDFESEVYYK